MDEPLQTTLADIVGILKQEHISFALIGGQATSLRGEARVTADIDLIIFVDLEQAAKLADQLAAGRFRPLFEDVGDVIRRAFILPVRHRETDIKVDLAIGLSGFEQQAIARAELMEVAGVSLPVATTEDLIIMKSLAGRPRDEQDLQGMVLAQGKEIDWDYCESTATELGDAIGVDLVARIRALRQYPPPQDGSAM